MQRDISAFAVTSAVTMASLWVGLLTDIIGFKVVGWLLIFWVKWGFAAFLSGGMLVLGGLVAHGIYERFISDRR